MNKNKDQQEIIPSKALLKDEMIIVGWICLSKNGREDAKTSPAK
jgi:hypothetical protein